MDFWAHINGKDYPICNGMSIKENFGQELDGGTIVLAHIAEKIDIKPYDDIYIHNYGEGNLPEHMFGHFFNGTNRVSDGSESYCNEALVPEYFCVGCTADNDKLWRSPIGLLTDVTIIENAKGEWTYNGSTLDLDEYGITITNPKINPITELRYITISKTKGVSSYRFFWHFLAWNITAQQLHRDNGKKNTPPDIYNYQIDLISETKGLERVQLPNRCITNRMRTNENSLTQSKSVFSVLEIAKELIELYSPYEKVTTNGYKWFYQRKYSISKRFEEMFEYVVCPEMTMNEPTLREALDELCNVSDCIVVVHDGLIDYINLSEVGKETFSIYDEDELPKLIGEETWAMNGAEYCDRLLKNYSATLSETAIVSTCENVGFRNYNSDSVTLDNLSIELAYPIYEIERVVMKYYIKIGDRYYEYKNDITPFVIRNEKRNQLSTDWEKFNYKEGGMTKEEFAKFRYATVGYSMGGKTITGWGLKYNFLDNFVFLNITKTRSVLENIVEYMAINYPEGFENPYMYTDIVASGDAISPYNDRYIAYNDGTFFKPTVNGNKEYYSEDGQNALKNAFSNQVTDSDGKSFIKGLFSCVFGDDGSYTQFLKTIVFEVKYKALTSASVVTTKQFHDGNVVLRDNMASAYGYFEKEGEKQKDKVNKLGNASISFVQRVMNHYSEYPLSATRTDVNHTDEIIYSKTTTFLNDYCSVTYYLAKNFVIRNMYTSVYTKNRAFAYQSRESAVTRMENKSVKILLSDNEFYCQPESKYLKTSESGIVKGILSFFNPTEFDDDYNPIYKNDIDTSYYIIPYTTEEGKHSGVFHSEMNMFSSGESLCCNITMVDSMSAGTYIGRWAPNFKNTISSKYMVVDAKHNADLLTGSLQEYSTFNADEDTGRIDSMHFAVGKKSVSGEAYKKSPSDQIRINGIYPLYPCYIASESKPSYAYIRGSSLGDDYKVGWSKFEPKSIVDSDSSTYYNTDRIEEKVSAIFGDGDNVYKDGNELVNLTMQFEVIPSDNIFLNNIVEYSDFFNKYKNYNTESKITATFRQWIYVEMNTDGNAQITLDDGSSSTFTPYIVYPVLDVQIDGPRDKEFKMTVGKTFIWHSGNYGNIVQMTVNTITFDPTKQGCIEATVTINNIKTTYYTGSIKGSGYMSKSSSVSGGAKKLYMYDFNYKHMQSMMFLEDDTSIQPDMYAGLDQVGLSDIKTNMLSWNDREWVSDITTESGDYYNISKDYHLYDIESFVPHHDKYIGVYSLIIDKIAFNGDLISGSVTSQGMTAANILNNLNMDKQSDGTFSDLMNMFIFDTTDANINYYMFKYSFSKGISTQYGDYRQSSKSVVMKRQTSSLYQQKKNINNDESYNMAYYYSDDSITDSDRRRGGYKIDGMRKLEESDVISYGEHNGVPSLIINVPDNAKIGGSIRLYDRYKGSDGKDKYKFVFGVNFTEDDINEGKKYVFVSVLDSLSKNVYYSSSGDKDYKIKDVKSQGDRNGISNAYDCYFVTKKEK